MGPQLFPLPTADTLKTDTVDPTVNDDINAGFSIGQHWINTTTDKGFECMDNAAGAAVWVETTAGASGGEINTASNVNVGGVGIFKQKAGVDLEFRGVNAASSKVSVALEALTNEIDVDIVEANLNIGNQSGTLTNDLAHGTRGGGSQHADVIAAGASGFMTGAQATKLDGLGVFGSDYQTAISTAQSTTTSTTFQMKVTLTTPSLTGTYRLGWAAKVGQTNTGDKVEARLRNTTDAATVGVPDNGIRIEPKDTNNRYPVGGFAEVVFAGAAKTFEIQYRQQDGNTARIEDARIEIWRVS